MGATDASSHGSSSGTGAEWTILRSAFSRTAAPGETGSCRHSALPRGAEVGSDAGVDDGVADGADAGGIPVLLSPADPWKCGTVATRPPIARRVVVTPAVVRARRRRSAVRPRSTSAIG